MGRSRWPRSIRTASWLARARTAEVHQLVNGRASRAAMVDDVVDQHDDLAVDVGQAALLAVTVARPEVQVVAMPGDVEPAPRHGRGLELGQRRREPAGEDVALAHDADEDDVLDAAVALHDLVRHARERAPDPVGVHHGGLEGDAHGNILVTLTSTSW